LIPNLFGMNIYYSDQFVVPLPEEHRFPMAKYALLRQQVEKNGLAGNTRLLVPPAATDAELLLVHTVEYLEKVKSGSLSEKETRRIGFPWSPELVSRSRRSVGGTIAACRVALVDGVAVNLAGGTHHAYPDHGEGFCVFNDCAVAARVIQTEHRVKHILILDLDVHQGNGTARIFQGDSTVFTLSVHGQKNFPFHKETSDLDIALEDGADDQDYLEAVMQGFKKVDSSFRADFIIYLAGSDPFEGDKLGRMKVSKNGLAERDRLVFSWASQLGLPIAVTMAGGYARNVSDTVDIHFKTVQTAQEFWAAGKQ
jgi:acetoin utilization deacetylase AcuC-like enzyme